MEQQVGQPRGQHVERVDRARGQRVDGDRPVLQGADHLGRGLLGRQRGRPAIEPGRPDHVGAHQRHPHVGEGDVVAEVLPRGDPAEHVERRLGREVGRELRRLHQHAPAEHVDHVPEAAVHHRRQQAHGQPHGPEVVDLHGALEVVHAVVGRGDRPADRPARVVDQVVDSPVLGEHHLDQVVDRLTLGEVAGIAVGRATGVGDLHREAAQLVGPSCDQQHDGPAGRALACRRLADAGGGAGDHDRAATQRRRHLGPGHQPRQAAHLGGGTGQQDRGHASHSAGLRSAHGRAFSISALSATSVGSAPWRPTSCTEVGRPSANPAGTAAAGWPVTFQIAM